MQTRAISTSQRNAAMLSPSSVRLRKAHERLNLVGLVLPAWPVDESTAGWCPRRRSSSVVVLVAADRIVDPRTSQGSERRCDRLNLGSTSSARASHPVPALAAVASRRPQGS